MRIRVARVKVIPVGIIKTLPPGGVRRGALPGVLLPFRTAEYNQNRRVAGDKDGGDNDNASDGITAPL